VLESFLLIIKRLLTKQKKPDLLNCACYQNKGRIRVILLYLMDSLNNLIVNNVKLYMQNSGNGNK
jgi:hypothetical protein